MQKSKEHILSSTYVRVLLIEKLSRKRKSEMRFEKIYKKLTKTSKLPKRYFIQNARKL
jgi:hypothetical protein